MIKLWELKANGVARPLPVLAGESSLDELSRRLPQGLYSTFRTFGERTRVLDLRHHLDRLYRPAVGLTARPVVDETALCRVLADLLAAFPAPEARVRLSLSTEARREGAVFLAIEPLKPLADEIYQKGVRAITSRQERANPQLKSTAFITASEQARKELAAAGAFEALMLHHGRILEGLTSNFYFVRGGVLGTAAQGILPGVTRRLVLRLARLLGIPRSYRAMALEQLPAVDEAFITSSSRGIMPVVRIDGQRVGLGVPGPVTRLLMERYDVYVAQHAGSIAP